MKPVRLRLEPLEAREVPVVVGTLDTTFGTGGVLQLPGDAAVFPQWGNSLGLDSQGRFVALAVPGGDFQAAPSLVRLNSDGALDATFGTNGSVTLTAAMTDIGLPQGYSPAVSPGSVAVDASGRVYFAGHVGRETGQLAVTRFTAAGVLDTTFGTHGTALIAIPAGYTSFTPQRLAIDRNGNAVIVEHLYAGALTGFPDALGVVRLDASGLLDATFNSGQVKVVDAIKWPFVAGLTIDTQNRIVIAGDAGGVITDFLALRLAADGSLDTSFNGTGYRKFAVRDLNNNHVNAVTTDADGNVYLGGTGHDESANRTRVVVVKLTEAGATDVQFAAAGVHTVQLFATADALFDSYSGIGGLAVQPDGSVIVGATVKQPATGPDFAVLRLTPAGKLDPYFNPVGPTPGVNTFDFGQGASEVMRWLALNPQGQILVGGFASYFGTPVANVARLNGTGNEVLVDWGGVVIPQPFGEAAVPQRSARGDVNADGFDDSIRVTRAGRPTRVAVLSGPLDRELVATFDPFGGDFDGGGYVAAGDFDGDGKSEFVVTPDNGGGPRVVIFSVADGKAVLRASFFGIDDANFRGGARIAVGDVNGDGTPDLVVTAGNGGGPRAAVFDGRTLLTNPRRLTNDFYAMPGELLNGVFVGVSDFDLDGKGDLYFGAGPGGAPRVRALSAKLLLTDGADAANKAPLLDFYAEGDEDDREGVRIDAADGTAAVGEQESHPSRVFRVELTRPGYPPLVDGEG